MQLQSFTLLREVMRNQCAPALRDMLTRLIGRSLQDQLSLRENIQEVGCRDGEDSNSGSLLMPFPPDHLYWSCFGLLVRALSSSWRSFLPRHKNERMLLRARTQSRSRSSQKDKDIELHFILGHRTRPTTLST